MELGRNYVWYLFCVVIFMELVSLGGTKTCGEVLKSKSFYGGTRHKKWGEQFSWGEFLCNTAIFETLL